MTKSLKQCLSFLRGKATRHQNYIFHDIIGRENIKQIFLKAIQARKPVHLLLLGSPGSAKSLFLTEVMKNHKSSYFVVGSNATRAGLLNQLFERKPKFLLVDEIDKMSPDDQTSLLHLMETGIISETKLGKTRQTELTTWVFATANSYKKIIQPLLSRFMVLKVADYTFQEFTDIAISKLQRENVDKDIATEIAEKIWYDLESKDIRDVIKVGRLASNIDEINFVVRMMSKLSKI